MKITVTKKDDGLKLFAFLRDQLKDKMSVKAIKRLIDGKAIRINGKVVFLASDLLKKGDEVEISALVTDKAEKVIFPILYEDEHLLIVDKSPGVVCTLEEIKKHLPKGKKQVLLVHRLDKDTSGVLILAKNGNVQKSIEGLFKEKKISKRYLAIVAGIPKLAQGVIDSRLGVIKKWEGQTLYGSGNQSEAKRAITHWKLLKKGSKTALLLLMPLTGRTHQLRVHLSEMGHPIIGDAYYGPSISRKLHALRHLLHAYQISFLNPWDGEELLVTAPLPTDFKEFLSDTSLK